MLVIVVCFHHTRRGFLLHLLTRILNPRIYPLSRDLVVDSSQGMVLGKAGILDEVDVPYNL